MTAWIDKACGEEKTLKNTGLRSETGKFLASCAGNTVHLECARDFLF